MFIVAVFFSTKVSLTEFLFLGPSCQLTFQPARSFSLKPNYDPMSVKVADLNNDGHLDLVICFLSCNVGILFGNGNGNFVEQMVYPTGDDSFPTVVAVDHINRDEHFDIAIINKDANNIGILLGNGNGTFAEQIMIPTGSGSATTAMAFGEFNRDSHLDFAIIFTHTDTESLGIWLGNGDGTFAEQAPLSLTLYCWSYSIATGDFNRDGQLDLALTCVGLDNVVVLFGIGNGTFSGKIVLSTGYNSGPNRVAVKDFNCDNYVDLAVLNRWRHNVGIWLGNGNGTFESQKTYSTGPASLPSSMVVNDFNNDNILDIATLNTLSQNVGIHLGTGNGTFLEQITYLSGANVHLPSIAAGDFNSDGKLDLVIVDDRNNQAYILLNSCDCCLCEAAKNCTHSHP